MNSTPKVLHNIIEQFSRLPGIGPKSAARIAFHILNMPEHQVLSFAKALHDIKHDIIFCNICHNIGESAKCDICNNLKRNDTQIMVVEDVLDLIAFEGTSEYMGRYHVLGGVISPVNGIGPEELYIRDLYHRLPGVKEIIIATNPNLEGEATAMYLSNEIKKYDNSIEITRIARGVPSGADLDYTDKLTLSRALNGRTSI